MKYIFKQLSQYLIRARDYNQSDIYAKLMTWKTVQPELWLLETEWIETYEQSFMSTHYLPFEIKMIMVCWYVRKVNIMGYSSISRPRMHQKSDDNSMEESDKYFPYKLM